MAKQKYTWNELNLGVCYYPEHWDKGLWSEDLDRMLAAGLETIRIAEFAWSKVEPKEGEFTYAFWDEFLDLCESKGMKVIFCTPTATPPAWLTEKYPEVLNCTNEGVPYRHGMRGHYNYNSEKYLELCSIITEKTAQHYGKRPCIIGWQLGNEQNCETMDYYSEADNLAFRIFLQKKYGTLDELNRAWGTVFWNQDYTEWSQVYIPRISVPGGNNPHQLLDYNRFISESAIKFMQVQADIIRKYVDESVFITTNGLFGRLDNHKLENEVLDVYTYDSYPNFAFALDEPDKNDEKLKDRWWSKHLAETRSVCSHFGIMEQQAGAMGWNYRLEGPAPKPGQLSLWALQSIAHGADFVSFFRWRTCTFSTEMYWHGIIDYDNCENRKYREVKKLSKRIANLQELCGSEFAARVALVKDYDNVFDESYDTWHSRVAGPSEREIYVAAQLGHTPLNIEYINDETNASELMKYKVLIYPHAEILTEKRVSMLEEYVRSGGTLIVGARTGQKDIDGHCVMMQMPGFLSRICGANVKEYTFISDREEPVSMSWEGDIVETGNFNDVLAISDSNRFEASGDVQVLGQYIGNYYLGEPALVEKRLGSGKVIQFGGTFTRKNTKKFLEYAGVYEEYRNVINVPENVELCVREKEGKKYYILLNYGTGKEYIGLFKDMRNIETGEIVSGLLTLSAYGVVVLGEA